MDNKIKIFTIDALYIVFERDTFQRITYDGKHWKLNFPLAYELYKKDPQKRCMYALGSTIIDNKQALIEMTESEIEDLAQTIKSKISRAFDISDSFAKIIF